MPVCKRNQGGKASPKKSKLTIFDNLVYAVLFVVMVAEIAIGPLKQLMDDETKFVKEKVSVKNKTSVCPVFLVVGKKESTVSFPGRRQQDPLPNRLAVQVQRLPLRLPFGKVPGQGILVLA